MKYIIGLVVLILSIALPTTVISEDVREVVVEFSFEEQEYPDKYLDGYILYKDGVAACDSNIIDGTLITCNILTDPGTFDFTLTAHYTDNSQSPHSPIYSYTVIPMYIEPVVANMSCDAREGEIPLDVFCDGSNSTGEVLSYNWHFGEGQEVHTALAGHTYENAGMFTITFRVVGEANTDSISTTIIAENPPPPPEPPLAVIYSSPSVGDAPLSVTFDGNNSYTSNTPITSYIWFFGDGGSDSGSSVTHEFKDPGTYTTRLTITDSANLEDTASTPVIVSAPVIPNEMPIAVIDYTVEGMIVNFDGSKSSDSDGTIADYFWDLGDGTTTNAISLVYEYTVVDSFDVTLTVTDDDGDSSNTSTTITIEEPVMEDINYEVGKITIDHQWASVAFESVFEKPVVIAGPPSSNELEPVTVRIRNITTKGFEVRLQEWDYQDGIHVEEDVSYIVLDEGIHTLEDGTKIEAGTFLASNRFKNIYLAQSYDSTPVILTQIITENETDAVVGRIRKSSQTQFQYKLQEQELNKRSHGKETMGYIAWEQSIGTSQGLNYEAVITSNKVTHNWYPIEFGTTFIEIPAFIGNMQTKDGGDTSVIRIQEESNISIQVKIEEDQSKDSEVKHTTEAVGYLIIGNKN